MPTHHCPPDLLRAPRTDIGVEELRQTPAWLPFESLAGDTFRLVQLTAADYRSASFLDVRILQKHPLEGRFPAATLAAAAERLAPEAHFIFHIGHVGSTLLSRLSGEHPALFALREPTLLRAAAPSSGSVGCSLTLREQVALLSRTWRPDQHALIKATSFVNEISSALLECAPGSRALLLFTSAPVYLRAILAGANSRRESQALAPLRLARLTRSIGQTVPHPNREGEWIALSWLCEMTALQNTARRHAAQVQWLDFEHFLREPVDELTAVLRTFGVQPHQDWINAVLAGPLMRCYSKAPEHAYDPQLRRAVLAQAEREHGPEIRAALTWLERLGSAHPLVASALAR